MTDHDAQDGKAFDDESDLEATDDQIKELIALGVSEEEARGMSVADAADLIDELRSERQSAERFDKG